MATSPEFDTNCRVRWLRRMLAGWALLLALGVLAADKVDMEVPLVLGDRTIHVFRAALGAQSAAERADAARRRIVQALEAGGGEGWTSVAPTDTGLLVALDGVPMFTVVAADAPAGAGLSPEALANQASRVLQKVWAEARERRDPRVDLGAVLRVVLAAAVLLLLLAFFVWMSRALRRLVAARLGNLLGRLPATGSGLVVRLAARLSVVALGLLGLVAVFSFLAYALAQFARTRPVAEGLRDAVQALLTSGLRAAADALPGVFVAVVIFMLARIATQMMRALFDRIAAGSLQWGALDAHTAPATRQLVNGGIWLFALAMAYPYLPGSHTEAFKGLSVLLGVMVSIGASGLVGQVASGMILVFTRALLVGEYVRIQECEGTVTQLGLCVTRLRTGTGEEMALPNSLVIGHVTRNFSRAVDGGGFVLDTSVTIGYDTPWRQVHAMLLEAAQQLACIRAAPAPFVLQSALSDFYVEYRLVVQVGAESAAVRPRVLGELNAAIQDVFNTYGVQIMSPHYLGDPVQAKLVPRSNWRPAPAAPADAGKP